MNNICVSVLSFKHINNVLMLFRRLYNLRNLQNMSFFIVVDKTSKMLSLPSSQIKNEKFQKNKF